MSGVVTDAATGAPIAGASVILINVRDAAGQIQPSFRRPDAQTDAKGRFVFVDLPSTLQYQVAASHQGHNVGEATGGVSMTLVLSNRHTELSGTLTTAAGAGASDVFVLAFPAESALRRPGSRRVQAVRPDSNGRFVIENLPAGRYLLCALIDVDEGEWNDPGFFDPLVPAAAAVTLADGEKRIQNLRLGGGS